MIYYLYGLDAYRLQQKVQEIVARFLEVNPGAGWENIDGAQLEAAGFWDLLNQQSLFVKKKLLVLENLLENSQLSQAFLLKIKEIVASAHIVVVVDKPKKTKRGAKNKEKGPEPSASQAPDKNKKLITALKKYGQAQEFEFLSGQLLKQWVVAEFQQYGVGIEQSALTKLVAGVGQDMWRLSQEINKLANYRKSGAVTQEDLAKLVALDQAAAIFVSLDALASRNKKQALGLLLNHLQKGESIFYLLSMLAFQFRNLLMIKAAQDEAQQQNTYLTSQQLAKMLDLNPFVAKKASQLASRFSLVELKKIYQKIFVTDLALKTSSLTPETALRLLVAEV